MFLIIVQYIDIHIYMEFGNIHDDTSKIKTYVGSDGKLHFVNKAGADTVLNFSGAKNLLNIELAVYTMAASAYYGNMYNSIIPCEQYKKIKIRTVEDGSLTLYLYGGNGNSQNIKLLYTHSLNQTYSSEINIEEYDYVFIVNSTGRRANAYMFTG